MNEIEDNTLRERPRINRMAIVSLLFVILGFFTFLITCSCLQNIRILATMGFCVCVFLIISGLVLGVIADSKIYKSKGRLTGRVFSILGTGLGIVFLLLLVMPPPTPPHTREIAYRILCGCNLGCLGKLLNVYNNEYGDKYPTPNKWCDLLIKFSDVNENPFLCDGAVANNNKERCHYAINSHCEPNSDANTVLLFETKGGWNQFGGPELLTTENHKGKGCNILFSNGQVKFIKSDEIKQLKWK